MSARRSSLLAVAIVVVVAALSMAAVGTSAPIASFQFQLPSGEQEQLPQGVEVAQAFEVIAIPEFQEEVPMAMPASARAALHDRLEEVRGRVAAQYAPHIEGPAAPVFMSADPSEPSTLAISAGFDPLGGFHGNPAALFRENHRNTQAMRRDTGNSTLAEPAAVMSGRTVMSGATGTSSSR